MRELIHWDKLTPTAVAPPLYIPVSVNSARSFGSLFQITGSLREDKRRWSWRNTHSIPACQEVNCSLKMQVKPWTPAGRGTLWRLFYFPKLQTQGDFKSVKLVSSSSEPENENPVRERLIQEDEMKRQLGFFCDQLFLRSVLALAAAISSGWKTVSQRRICQPMEVKDGEREEEPGNK